MTDQSPTPDDDSANATTGAGLEALTPEAETEEARKTKIDKSEADAATFAEAAAAFISPSPGAGRYDGGEEP